MRIVSQRLVLKYGPGGCRAGRDGVDRRCRHRGAVRFREGQGERVACEVKAPPAILHGATWVPGREGWALATDRGHAAIADDPALRPARAVTVEVWVKLRGRAATCSARIACT